MYVNTVNSKSNRIPSERDSSRSLTLKSECIKGGGTVEFVHILAFRNEQLQNFASLPLHVTLFEINKSRTAKRVLIGQLKCP